MRRYVVTLVIETQGPINLLQAGMLEDDLENTARASTCGVSRVVAVITPEFER